MSNTFDNFPRHMDDSARRYLACLAVLFAILAVLSLTVDLTVSSFARGKTLRGDLAQVIHLSEVFGHGAGILLIVLTIHVLDPARRRRLPRLLATVFGAGLAVNVVKACVARYRPNASEHVIDVWQSFIGWLPVLRAGQWELAWNTQIQSFPSGHTVTAVAFAISLSILYPRGRWLFAMFAVLAAMQRVFAGLHYPSDTLVAAALACVVARWTHGANFVGRGFDRFESGSPLCAGLPTPQAELCAGLPTPHGEQAAERHEASEQRRAA